MSDVGLNFSALDIILYGAIIALPLTTILLVILVWRRFVDHPHRRALNAGIVILGLLWAVPAGLFEDGRIAGETWTKGRTVFRDDLDLPPTARP